MTQYRLLSYRKWLSIGYWARYLNIWNVVANNSEQGIYLSSANIYHQRTGGDVPWWPGCTPAELLPMTQYSILSHNKLLSIEYWVIKDTESLYCNISTLCSGSMHKILRCKKCHCGPLGLRREGRHRPVSDCLLQALMHAAHHDCQTCNARLLTMQ